MPSPEDPAAGRRGITRRRLKSAVTALLGDCRSSSPPRARWRRAPISPSAAPLEVFTTSSRDGLVRWHSRGRGFQSLILHSLNPFAVISCEGVSCLVRSPKVVRGGHWGTYCQVCQRCFMGGRSPRNCQFHVCATISRKSIRVAYRGCRATKGRSRPNCRGLARDRMPYLSHSSEVRW